MATCSWSRVFDALDVFEPSAQPYVDTNSAPVYIYLTGSFTSRGMAAGTKRRDLYTKLMASAIAPKPQ